MAMFIIFKIHWLFFLTLLIPDLMYQENIEKEAKILMRPKYVKRASLIDQSGNAMLSPEERNKKRTAKHKQAIEKMAKSEARRAMFVSSAQSGLKGNYFIVG